MAKKTDPASRALKDMYDAALLKRMSKALQKAWAPFPSSHFCKIAAQLTELEMKQRVFLIRDELHRLLPPDYKKALSILRKSIKLGELRGFDLWPYTEFVQTYGLDHFEVSMQSLREFTVLFTAEWAVRPFLKKEPQRTRQYLLECAQDSNVHVRRWASEGSRPRLPWGERLQDLIQDPRPNLPILEQLRFDDELYVRKSVANHLNDISKDHPGWVCQILAKWRKTTSQNELSKINWIIRHALRTLIKKGHPEALALIGIRGPARLRVSAFQLHSSRLQIGETLRFEFKVQSTGKQTQKIVVDYVLHFKRANGQNTPKVFKLKTTEIKAGQVVSFRKDHPIKTITTRSYYSGEQILEIQINGQALFRKIWHLQLKPG